MKIKKFQIIRFRGVFVRFTATFSTKNLSMPAYRLNKLKLGAEVCGIDLKNDVDEETIENIKKDVYEHKLLVFRDQGRVSAERHVAISRWFGELESVFYQHPAAEHYHVFRVSNDPAQGCRNVGRTGWHIDGSFMKYPYSHSLYHMVSVPSAGDTVFAPLTEIVEGLPSEQRARWERLSMVSDRRENIVHPLIYSHPVTQKPVLCFHMGMTDLFSWDHGTSKQRFTNQEDTRQLLEEINHEFVKNYGAIQYSHKWQVGDFIISDNLAVGHEASPDSQRPVSEVGLRVLHRTTVSGTVSPKKNYKL